MFCQTLYLDFLIFILQNFQDLVIIQQVIDFAAINLVHGDGHGKVSLIILPVVDSSFKEILYGQILEALHRKCLS